VPEFTVECQDDLQPRQTPTRFGWEGRMRIVTELIDCWEGDDDIYFRVRADDDATYILHRSLSLGRWEIHFFRSKGEG
jgi:hypothetical protein